MLMTPEWKSKAACAEMNTAFFFYEPAGNDVAAWEQSAKDICERCPVKEECLESAIKHNELGIWGGTNEAERRRIRRQRGKRDNPKFRNIDEYLVDKMAHGTPARRTKHYRDGEKPCERCRISIHEQLVDKWQEKKKAKSSEREQA